MSGFGLPVPDQRTQEVERLGELAAIDERPGVRGTGRGGRLGDGRCGGLARGGPRRRGEGETGGDRKSAEEKVELQIWYSQGYAPDRKKRVANSATLFQKFELQDQGLTRRARSG